MHSDLASYDGYDAMMLGDIPTTQSRVVQAEMPGLFGTMDDEKAVFDSINSDRSCTPRTLADDEVPAPAPAPIPTPRTNRTMVIGALAVVGLVLGLTWLAKRK